MGQFFFDVFDGTRAVRDDFGDVFAGVDDAADLAAGLLADFARAAAPAGLSQDYGVIVRDAGDRDVYQAMLSFRAAFLDGRAPPGPPDRGPAAPRPDPADLIRRSQETRAASRELQRQLQVKQSACAEALRDARRTAQTLRSICTVAA